jgi:hypothetical protein
MRPRATLLHNAIPVAGASAGQPSALPSRRGPRGFFYSIAYNLEPLRPSPAISAKLPNDFLVCASPLVPAFRLAPAQPSSGVQGFLRGILAVKQEVWHGVRRQRAFTGVGFVARFSAGGVRPDRNHSLRHLWLFGVTGFGRLESNLLQNFHLPFELRFPRRKLVHAKHVRENIGSLCTG